MRHRNIFTELSRSVLNNDRFTSKINVEHMIEVGQW